MVTRHSAGTINSSALDNRKPERLKNLVGWGFFNALMISFYFQRSDTYIILPIFVQVLIVRWFINSKKCFCCTLVQWYPALPVQIHFDCGLWAGQWPTERVLYSHPSIHPSIHPYVFLSVNPSEWPWKPWPRSRVLGEWGLPTKLVPQRSSWKGPGFWASPRVFSLKNIDV